MRLVESAVAQRIDQRQELAAAQNGGVWEYLLPDALGSVRQIADANGNVTLAKSYEPYGTVLTSTGTASSIFGYAGEQADTTGLIYLRARYMNPRLGIFLARDPWNGDQLRPGSMNGFGYVEGDPINSIDPNGLSPWAPTMEEGKHIHRYVIEPDFLDWGSGRGYRVGREVCFAGASKNCTGENGFADLVDYTNAEIYDIKSRNNNGWMDAQDDAQWYIDHLNRDLGSANIHWKLGSRYLRGMIKDFGQWPLYPNYDIKATLQPLYPDDSHTGAIIYWGERNSTPDPDLLTKLAILYAFCEELLKSRNRQMGLPEGGVLGPTAVKVTKLEAHAVHPLEEWFRRTFGGQ